MNKGKARKALARAVFFNRLDELRDHTFESQMHRASGLNLVAFAIILWNTVYLGRAFDHLRHQGANVPDHLLAYVAPLGWEHVSFTGDYLWGDIDSRAGGSGYFALWAQAGGLSVRLRTSSAMPPAPPGGPPPQAPIDGATFES